MRFLGIALALAAAPAFADFNDKKPINATVTGATPSGYPRTMVEGLNAVVRDTYPGSAVSFKPNSPGGGVLAIAEGQADFTATATGTEVKLANDGTAPFSKPLNGKFSYVMQLYDNQFIHFLMTKEWAEQNGIARGPTSRRRSRACPRHQPPDNPQTTDRRPVRSDEGARLHHPGHREVGRLVRLGNSQIGLDAITDGKAVFMNARNLGDSLVKDVASKRSRFCGSTATAGSFRRPRMFSTTKPTWSRRAPIRSWKRTTRRCACGSRCSPAVTSRTSGLQVRESSRREREARTGHRRIAEERFHDREDDHQPRQPSIPPWRLALLQGKGTGEVLCVSCGRGRGTGRGAWWVFIQAASVVAALYVLWIGALATIVGTAALNFGLTTFGTCCAVLQFHLDISIFIAITFPIAFLTTTAGPWRSSAEPSRAGRGVAVLRCTTSCSTTSSCTGAAVSRSPRCGTSSPA